MPATAKKIATSDVEVPAPHATEEDLADLAAAAAAPTPTDRLGEPEDIHARMEAHSAAARASQSASRKANGSATTKPDPKPAAVKARKPKASPMSPVIAKAKAMPAKAKAKVAKAPRAKAAPKPPVARVPAEKVAALVKELGLTNTQFGQAIGVSPSSVSEYVGHGRGKLMDQSRWANVEKKARAFAKGLK